VKIADIYRQTCEVHSENDMSDEMVRKWFRKFNECRHKAHDESYLVFIIPE
jgi:hypothetical protein